jgi:hypothetical protein
MVSPPKVSETGSQVVVVKNLTIPKVLIAKRDSQNKIKKTVKGKRNPEKIAQKAKKFFIIISK